METMSRSIKSFPEDQRKEAVLRRLKKRTKGIGFWAAMDAAKKHYPKDVQVSSAVPKGDS